MGLVRGFDLICSLHTEVPVYTPGVRLSQMKIGVFRSDRNGSTCGGGLPQATRSKTTSCSRLEVFPPHRDLGFVFCVDQTNYLV